MNVKEDLNKLRETFMLFENPKDKFVQLMDMAKQSQNIDISEKSDLNRVNGCTSQAWVIVDPNNDGTYTIRADSDALIVKGLLTILEIIFTNKVVEEILSTNSQDILNSVGLENVITSQRTNGFSNAVKKIHSLVK
tara:strand:- start:276 stop:683 length:408 start_codon:yes stop_codon:yes gene_type:complete